MRLVLGAPLTRTRSASAGSISTTSPSGRSVEDQDVRSFRYLSSRIRGSRFTVQARVALAESNVAACQEGGGAIGGTPAGRGLIDKHRTAHLHAGVHDRRMSRGSLPGSALPVQAGSRDGTDSRRDDEATYATYDLVNFHRARVTARSSANGSGPPPRAVCHV